MKRWKKNLWILWCTQIISLASFGFGIPFMPLYIQEIEILTETQVKMYATILAGAPALAMGIMAPIWGFLADKYGRKLMILRAMFFAVFVIGLMGAVTSINQLIVLRVLQGVFTGTVTAAFAFISSNTPEDHLSYAMGIISSSTFIGYSFGPVIGGLFADMYGYRYSFYLGGGLMLVGAILVLLFVKEDKSLLSKTSISIVLKYKKVIMPIIIIILIMILFLRITRSLFSPYIPLLVEKIYGSSKWVSSITGIINALVGIATAVASMLVGRILKNRKKINVLSVLIVSSFVISIILINYSSIASILSINELYVFSALYILFYFSLGGIEPILSSSAAIRVKAEDRGSLSGLQGMIGNIGWFIAPFISGTIVYSYDIEYVLLSIPMIIFINILLVHYIRKISA